MAAAVQSEHWTVMSADDGTKGPRFYDWTRERLTTVVAHAGETLALVKAQPSGWQVRLFRVPHAERNRIGDAGAGGEHALNGGRML